MEEIESLTQTERAQMRGFLSAYMMNHPLKVPFLLRTFDWLEREFSAAETALSRRVRVAGAAFAVVLVAGVGTSYAASSALPGDMLYSVKINVNEKIEAAMATSPAAQAQFDASLTARRLEEAEVLAAQNKLSPSISTAIEASINDATANFNQHVEALAATDDGAANAANVQSDLEATLAAHAHVLASLTTAVPGSKDDLTSILSAVNVHVTSTRNARARTENAVAASSSEPTKVAAAAKSKADAQQALGTIQSLAQQVVTGSGATSSQPIVQTADAVEAQVSEGEQHLNRGDYGRAFGAFQSAIRAASETRTETDVRMQLHKILPALPLEASSTDDTIVSTSSATSSPDVTQ